MKKVYSLVILCFFSLFFLKVQAQDLIHYWNFNDATSEQSLLTSQSVVSGSSITYTLAATTEVANDSGSGFDAVNENARNGDQSSTHLRFNDPVGGTLVFSLPTTGYENPIVKFTTRRSGSGAGTQTWSYTLDGEEYEFFQTVAPNNGNPNLVTLDFSSIAGADNNPNFKLKVEFAIGTGGDGGNNRFDNFTMDASQVGGVDTTPPSATFYPLNNSTNVAVNDHVTISFNEAVRLLNNDALTPANIQNIIDFKAGGENGTAIAFTASITGNTISLTPNAVLNNNQNYYVAVKANSIEDHNDNALETIISTSFSTIALQTAFNPGDITFLGYRMNNTDSEDEIALLILKDIDPGTFFTITDAKYTSNAVEQCSGGLVWTVGENDCISAGTIVRIFTDAATTSHGTLTGSGFGLSSGGDQVIIYAGTAGAPTYVTALSSNGWVTENTSCSGSNSQLPAGLADGTSSLNTSTAPGNVSGNSVNAYYNGPVTGDLATIKANVFNPANWIATAGSTPAQVWPEWNFPSSLKVNSAVVVNPTTIEVEFNQAVNEASAENIANYTGIADLESAVLEGNVVTLTYGTPFSGTETYTLVISNVEDTSGNALNCAFTHEFSYNTSLSLASTFVVVNEDEGTLEFALNLINPAVASIDVVVKGAPFSTADEDDFTLESHTINFTAESSLNHIISIPIIDDTIEEQQAEYFVLSFENPVGLTLEGESLATIFIKDNDRLAPVPSQQLTLDYVRSFDPSGEGDASTEVVVYDAETKRLFVTSGIQNNLDIIDFTDPTEPSVIESIDMTEYGSLTSVAVKNGILAVASPNTNITENGKVIFFDTDGTYISEVTVGVLPDNVVFSTDGNKVLTANEGQPNQDYSIDPEGSVSVIDVSNGVVGITQDKVSTLLFTEFNAQESTLIASGVRKLKLTSTLSQDFEPEYIAVNAESTKAWVTLQENNAIAEIDLTTKTITSVWAMGTKDMSLPGNGFDASDNNGEVLIANWPVESYYIPDAVGTYTVNGVNYIVTANEGDEKEYDGFEERVALGSNNYQLDADAFPNTDILKLNHNLGRFRVTNLNGDLNNDGKFEKIRSVGARSFSIFNADTKEIIFDSGDDFEMYTSAHYPEIFNSDHEENAPKGRSRSKGPEPEGVTIAQLGEETFAFIALERVGGVMAYNVTNPAQPVFADYKNARSTSSYGGDNGAETLIYIAPADSPTEKAYLVIANEVSGTLTIYEVNSDLLSVEDTVNDVKTFAIFPNPAKDGVVYFNREASVQVYDLNGQLIFKGDKLKELNTSGYASGIYIIKTEEGISKKLIVK